MQNKNVLIDVDGPLTRGFFHKACEFLRAEGVPNAYLENITEWDICRSFNVSEEVERNVRTKLRAQSLAQHFLPNPGALSFLTELRMLASVYAVTAPLDGSPTWSYDREQWLCSVLGFTPDKIISCRDKRLIGGDIFVDDKLTHLQDWKNQHQSGTAILWIEPHNRKDAEQWPGPKVNGYVELKDKLRVLRRF